MVTKTPSDLDANRPKTREELWAEVVSEAVKAGEIQEKHPYLEQTPLTPPDIEAEIAVREKALDYERSTYLDEYLEENPEKPDELVPLGTGELNQLRSRTKSIGASIDKLKRTISDKKSPLPWLIYFFLLAVLVGTEFIALIRGVETTTIPAFALYPLAILAAITLGFCAHILGLLLTKPDADGSRRRVIVLVSAIAFFLLVLSFARQLGFEFDAEEAGNSVSSPTISNLFLISLQLVVFVLALEVSRIRAPYEEGDRARFQLWKERIAKWRAERKEDRLEGEVRERAERVNEINLLYETKQKGEEAFRKELDTTWKNMIETRALGEIKSDHDLEIIKRDRFERFRSDSDSRYRDQGSWFQRLIWGNRFVRALVSFLIGLLLLLLIVALLFGVVIGLLALMGVFE